MSGCRYNHQIVHYANAAPQWQTCYLT